MTEFNPRYDKYLGEDEAYGASVGGTGSAQTLPMTAEECEHVAQRKLPLGFGLAEAAKPKKKAAKK